MPLPNVTIKFSSTKKSLGVFIIGRAPKGTLLGFYSGKYVFMEDSPFTKYGLPLREGDQQMIDGAVSSEWPLERFIAEKSVMSFANSCRGKGKSKKNSLTGTGCLNYRNAFRDNEKIWRVPVYASRDLEDEEIDWNYDFEALYHGI